MKKCLGVLLAVVVGLPVSALGTTPDLPVPVQQYETVHFYSGGVGLEERRSLPQLYPLKVVFATEKGHLLCDTEVTISAAGKTVFRGRAQNGPWLIVDLPPGTYDVVAVQEGQTRTAKNVRLTAGKQRTVLLKWKLSEIDMGL